MVWATYLGGKGDDAAHAIALDSKGNVWISGTTRFGGLSQSAGLVAGRRFRGGAECRGFGADLQFAPAGRYGRREPGGGRRRHAALRGVRRAGLDALAHGRRWRRASSELPTRRSVRRAGALPAGELISIYGPHIGPATPVTAVPDASGMMPRSSGRRAGLDQRVAGSAALRVGFAGERGDAAASFRASRRACSVSFNGVDYGRLRGDGGGGDPGNLPARRRHGGGRQSGWQHQLAGASGATGKHRCHLGDGNRRRRLSAPRRMAASLRARPDFGCCAIWAPGLRRTCCTEARRRELSRAWCRSTSRCPHSLSLYVTLTAGGATSHPVQIYVVPQVTAALVPF